MIEAFGTSKQKRALSSRKLNQVGSDTLHQAVAKAASTVIDQKGLEGKTHSCIVSAVEIKASSLKIFCWSFERILKERLI